MAKTNAEKQADHRQKMKTLGYTARLIWLPKETPTPLITPDIVRSLHNTASKKTAKKAERQTQWEAELRQEEKAERLKAARKAGRDSERKKYIERGYVTGVIDAACKMTRRSPEAAQVILHYLQVDRERAVNAGYDNFQLSVLDKSKAWNKPPAELLRN